MANLQPFVDERIWLFEYPIRYAGVTFNARTTVLKTEDGSVMLHSPGPIDDALAEEIDARGPVRYIVAPGNYHHLHVAACQRRYPDAKTYVCPGIERKQPQLRFDEFLSDTPPAVWADELEQVLLRGSRFMWEVAMLHRPTKTLLLVDLIENIGDRTPGLNAPMRFWWKMVFRMWNRPAPAPEYRMGWQDKAAARDSLERILAWDFERILIAHGENIERDAQAAAREAWRSVLR